MLEARVILNLHMVQRQHSIPLLWSRKPRMSQHSKYRHKTCSAFPHYIQHHLYSTLLSEKKFVSRMSPGKGKGRFKAESHEALLSGVVYHHNAACSYPAFKSVVEDPWPVTNQCHFSEIHRVRGLLLQQRANPGEVKDAFIILDTEQYWRQ